MHYRYIKHSIDEFVVEYLAYLYDKLPPEYVDSLTAANLEEGYDGESIAGHVDRYTYEFLVKMKLSNSIPVDCRWRNGATLSHMITVKMNPRMSESENLAKLKAKIKQKIYDWVYNIRKELQDGDGARSVQVNPKFRQSRMILMKFPEWIRPLITYFVDNGEGYDYADRYEVWAEPLPEDPRINDKNTSDEVIFSADTIRELKHQMELYRTRYLRLNYDY